MADQHDDRSQVLPDEFDRAMGALDGLPGMLSAGPSQVQSTTPMLGNVETFIVQTVRLPEHGETVFLQCLSARRNLRLVLPPKVTAMIARQHDALSARLRSKQARRVAADRKAAGIPPAFLKNPGRGGRARKRKAVR